MIVELKANDFKGTQYQSCTGCALSKRLQEMFSNKEILVGEYTLNIRNKSGTNTDYYEIEGTYSAEDFGVDKEMAKEFDYSPEIGIRKIKLNKYANRAEMVSHQEHARNSDGCLV